MSDYLFDASSHDGDVDPEVEALERLLAGFAHDQALRPLVAAGPLQVSRPNRNRNRERNRFRVVGAVVFVSVAAACVAIALLWPDPPPTKLAAVDPTPPPAPVHDRSEQDPTAVTAGVSCMQPGDEAGPTEGVDLDRGCRLVRSDGPPGWAVEGGLDLDCVYNLRVDEAGDDHLRVTYGSVTLEVGDVSVWVPADHELWLRPGGAPGLPLTTTASADLRDAAERFDAGDRAALTELLALIGEADVGTLWNLLQRTEGDEHDQVLDRLAQLHRPQSVFYQAAGRGLELPWVIDGR